MRKVIPDHFKAGDMIGEASYAATWWFDGKFEGKEKEDGTKEPDEQLIVRAIEKESAGVWVTFFQFEEEILHTLKHRYILPCYGFWEGKDDEDEMILMPFPKCRYSSMEELVEENEGFAIAEPQVRQYMGQISQAIVL